MKIIAVWLCVSFLIVASGSAGEPQIDNVDLDSRVLEQRLSAWLTTWSAAVDDPTWVGWHVPMIERDQLLCCWGRGDRKASDRACLLEGSHRHLVFSSDRPVTGIQVANLVVLVRAAEGELREVRAYSEGCRLDAGGRAVIWLEGVEPEESVALMAELVETRAGTQDEALMILAQHASPVAADRLVGLARQSADSDLRGEALFWVAQTGADQASEVILEAVAEDPDSGVREEAIFALSELPDDEGIPILLEILRDGSRPGAVREQAFFWYVQSGDAQALDLIAEILTD